MYDRIQQFGVVFLVSILIAALLVPIPTSAQAENPQWEEGDSWAMGAEKDLEELFAPGLSNADAIINQTEQSEDIKEINYNFGGKMGFYQIYEVTVANDDGYVMEINAGGGIQASGSFEMTAEMAKEGEYDMDEEIPMENKTMSAEGEIFYMLDMKGTIHYNETFAIEEIETDYSLEFSADFSVENFPSHDYDYENNTESWEYKDFSGGMSAEAGLQLQMDFEPALDLFDFPIKENEEWKAESNMTISGSYEGRIDVDDEELPEEFQQSINRTEEDLGKEFPIILEDLDTGTEKINNGQIKETSENITIPMKCTGREPIVLPDGDSTETYVLEFGTMESETLTQQEPSFKMMYSDDVDFIVSQQMDMAGQMDSEIGNMIDMGTIEMEPMDYEKAQESMEEMQEQDEGGEEDGFIDKLLSPPFLYVFPGIILILIVIALVIGKRGKSEKQPPQREEREQFQGDGQQEQEFPEQEDEWAEQEELN